MERPRIITKQQAEAESVLLMERNYSATIKAMLLSLGVSSVSITPKLVGQGEGFNLDVTEKDGRVTYSLVKKG